MNTIGIIIIIAIAIFSIISKLTKKIATNDQATEQKNNAEIISSNDLDKLAKLAENRVEIYQDYPFFLTTTIAEGAPAL